jgi:hypothetical protein
MLPKLQAVYIQGLLPELACPQEEKCSGIREPGIWVSLKIYDIRDHFLNSSIKLSIIAYVEETMRLVEINMIFLKL